MRSTLLLIAVLALGLPTVARSAVDSETRAVASEGETEKVPWRGSMIVYEHATTARTFDEGTDLTYNPVYVHNLSLRPEWHFSDYFFTRVRFDLEQELTDSDYTTRKNELVWSDLFFELGTRSFREDTTGLVLSGTLRPTVPVSRVSVARTMRFAASPSVHLTKTFNVLGGLVVRYSTRYTQRFYDSKTGTYDDHGIVGCRDLSCDALLSTGVRNSPWDISHGPLLMLMPVEGIALTTMMNWSRAQLYRVPDPEIPVLGRTETIPWSDEDPHARYGSAFLVDASWSALEELSISAGMTTFSPQLRPDGTRYSPFINRHTMFYLNFGVRMDALVSKL